VRSGKRMSLGLASAVVAIGLAGCVTTQEKNSWLLLRNTRTLASEGSVRVGAENASVRVRRVEVVRAPRSSAIVVSIANVGTRPLSDLPISVGVIGAHGTRTYLNARAGISYWDSHVSAIGPGATISWVLPYSGKGLTGRPFALVGSSTQPPSTTVATLPRITVAQGTGQSAGSLRIHLLNYSTLPQYGLQIYAVALRHGTAVGAGRAAVNELNGSGKATVGLTLAGNYAGAQLQLYAPPTIFK
jgi:hypothetical protein